MHSAIPSRKITPASVGIVTGKLPECRVQVNGEVVATGDAIRGMFLRHRIDITEQVSKAKSPQSSLELLIRPPDHVGCVDKG